MQKDFLFYAANFDPEINRMNVSFEKSEIQKFQMFKKIVIKTVENILQDKNLSSGGKEEWYVIKNLVESFESIDGYSKKVLLSYGVPFSYQFAKKLI